MITVYRIEDNLGEGPYFNRYTQADRKWSENWMNKRVGLFTYQPEPFEDDILSKFMDNNFNLNDYLCGFKDLQQVYEWFSKEELEKLSNLGFKVKAIEVLPEEVLIGKTQVLIKK